ncbi:MAG: hypothetical protein GX256_04170 [Fretibacterium sp.]|nr:hypothetical protein [Fretibacterium sp.]
MCRCARGVVGSLVGARAFAREGDVEAWRNSSYDFAGLRKVFLLPISADLRAEKQSSVVPQGQRAQDLEAWAVSSVQEALKKNTPIIKPFGALAKDMGFIYGATPDGTTLAAASAEVRRDFFKRAADMGFQAMLRIEVTQGFEVEHIPERTYTRTVYKEVEIRDEKGKKTGTIRIPEEKTEVVPAYDETYLVTRCLAKLYDLAAPEGDHVAAVDTSVYREYQGGPAIKVVENVLKSSMKKLFGPAGKK